MRGRQKIGTNESFCLFFLSFVIDFSCLLFSQEVILFVGLSFHVASVIVNLLPTDNIQVICTFKRLHQIMFSNMYFLICHPIITWTSLE